MGRMMGPQTAADMLGGKRKLAEAIDVTPRALDYKLDAQRGISNGDLMLAAMELEHRGARMLAHAAKLRAELPPIAAGVAPK